MQRKLNVGLLSAKEIDQAFPLVRTAWSSASLEGWRRFAGQRLAAGSASGAGILIVRNEQGCIVGLAAFRLCDDLLHGQILSADPICALDIVDQANVARALESGLEKIARRHGCSALHTTVTSAVGAEDWLCGLLHECGHHVQGLHLCKPIAIGS